MLRLISACLTTLLLCACACAQQEDYVSKYDVYGGFAYLHNPAINLAERGFHTQLGYNPKAWYSMGFDYSYFTGHTTLTQTDLNGDTQAKLTAQLAPLVAAGLIPPSFKLKAPIDSTTQTFAAGPQWNWRHYKFATFSIHPSIGAMHEVATPKTASLDPITKRIVQNLAPSGQKQDWAPFYGIGGSIDFRTPNKHVGVRLTTDYVRVHLFDDILGPRTSLRLSVGPSFHFGSNVAEK